ncbi:TonB-dependent receptor [soil metagenome]
MKIILSFFPLFLLTVFVHAQNSVSGIVTDNRDSAVSGVSVYIPEFQKYDETKAGGTYILRNVGKGNVHIQFSKAGYKTIIQNITSNDSTLVLNIRVQPTLMELEEVIITSNSSALTDNLPYDVNSVSIKEYHQGGSTTLMQGLALQPGIDRISVGNGIGKPVIRGLSFNRILVQEFGTRIDDQSWDDRHDIGIAENGVDRVEVIKGPAALIYGADAMGGALIFIDQKPAAAGTMLGDIGLGFHTNTRGLEGEAGLKGASAKGFFYSVRGGITSHTSYIQGEDVDEVKKNTEAKAFAHNSKWGNESAKAIFGFSKKWGVSKLSYSYYHQSTGIIEDEGLVPATTGSEDTEEQRDREYEAPYQDVATNIISSENTIITGNSKVNVNVAYQNNDRKEYEPISSTTDKKDKELAFGLKLSTVTYDLKWTSNPVKKFGVIVGSQGLFQSNKNFGMESLVPDAKSISDIAGYALLRYDIGKLNILAGVRYDMRRMELESYEPEGEVEPVHTIGAKPEIELEKDFTPVNGSLGFAYHPVEGITIKLNGASGFTAPNYAQLGTWGRHEGSDRFERGNKYFKVEQNAEGDLGILWESKNVDVNLSGFYNQVKNYIYLQNSGLKDTVTDSIQTILNVFDYVQHDATLSGGEVMVDIHPAPLKWVDLKVGYATMKGELDGGGNVPYIPANKLTGELTLRAKKLKWFYNPYVTFALSNYAAQKDTAQFGISSEAYSLIDIRIGLQLPFAHQVVDVNLAVTNLMNTPYMSYLSLVRSMGIRDMGRNVSIKIRIPFGLKGFNR